MEPIFRIVGTKTGQSLQDAYVLLSEYMCENNRLVEPFCGSASVSIAVQPDFVLLADLQPHTILTLQVLRSKPLALLASFDALRSDFLSDPTGDHFYKIRDNPPSNAVDRASWFIFITHAAFNWLWRVNSEGRCNTTFGDVAGIRRVKQALPRRNALALATWLDSSSKQIEHANAFDTIAQTGEGDLVYVDPPYVKQFDQYNAEKFATAGHLRLQKELHAAWRRGAQVVIQCNADQEVAALYVDFCKILLRPVRRVVSGGASSGKGNNDWEMIIVSQPHQCSLFPQKRPEDSSWFGGTTKPQWNKQEKRWETWTPPPILSLSLFQDLP